MSHKCGCQSGDAADLTALAPVLEKYAAVKGSLITIL